MSNLLEQLNPQQREAVEQTAGPLLILAGAGSGKTRVITFRIAYLIEVLQVLPEHILAVTFTNKAADQMKERVAKLLEEGRVELRPGAPHVSTFHSFCVSVLRRHIDRLGYTRDFSIYDTDDQQRLVKAAIEELGLAEQIASPRSALAQISYTKNRSLSAAELYELAPNPMTERLASLYDRYEAKLRKANALDFDDLLLKTVELFEKAPDVREQYNDRFSYILVDEYQDTNRVQYELIRHLTAAHSNLCVVGDEDQSIYRWRGADIQNILSFQKDYPGAKLVRLEQNYRSTQRILDAATAVVSRNVARIGKTLVTDRSGGEKVGLFEALDAEEEALWVAETIARALAAGREQSIAVLYRTNAQSRVFEEALRRQGIEYRLVGGFSFYARAEIRDALAYARLTINRRDDASFLRILNTPPRGIGDTTRAALEEVAQQDKLTLWEAVEHEMAERRLPARALRALEGFHALIENLARDRETLKLGEFFKSVVERTRYLDILRQENLPESQDRIENLQELVNAAREAEERGITLAELLDHAALVSDQDDYDERARVTLMTLHSAKGLEFNMVFLAGLEEGLFPHQLSLDDDAGIEEERRLCYVGMTRAKDRLVLSWARTRRSYGREAFEGTRASRFLSEIPEALLERLNLTLAGEKTRTTWDNAFKSASSVEEFFRRRNRSAGGIEREPPVAQSARSARWKLGAKVRHSQYGVGTIIDFEGEGEDTKLTVSFPGYGKKKLVERFAALERV